MADFKILRDLLDTMVGKYYPGIDMCIYKEHKPIFRYQAGYSDMENKIPVDPKSLYYLFSCSKPITCTAALQLFEKGEFLLTDPVYEYLPEFKDVTVREVDEKGNERFVAPKRPIIIRDLFTMTAGLDYDLGMEPIKEAIAATNGKAPTRALVAAIAKKPLSFHPGEKFQYSLCHDVIGGLIEVVSGKKLGEYMKENIFDPCGMENTGFKVTPDIKARIAPQYHTVGEDKKIERMEPLYNPYIFGEESDYESGGAGLVSCVDDYIKFADAMANGGVAANGNRILCSRTIDVMRAPFVPNTVFVGKSIEGYAYGLGVRTFQHPEIAGQLTSIGEFGWDGAASSYVIIDPAEKLAVFAGEHILGGYNHEGGARFTNAVYTALYSE